MENLKVSQMLQDECRSKSLSSEPNHLSLAAKRTAMMFGCYRKGEANDPEVYTMAIAATLAEYPAEVVEYVTDPRTGMPAKCKFLPTVAELREECERHFEWVRKRDDLIAQGWRLVNGRWVKPGEAA